MFSLSRTNALGYGNLTLGGVELEVVKSLRFLEANLHSTLTFETHLRNVSKAARSLGVVRRPGKLFDCPSVLKNFFNAYVLSSLKYCAPCGCCLRSLIWVCRICCSQCGNVVCV